MTNTDYTSQMISYTNRPYEEIKRYHFDSADTLNELRKNVMEELQMDAEDEEFEEELEERLSKLDDLSRSEFYRLRTNRKNNGVLSAKDLDLLTLEAMEKSNNYNLNK